jgi:hypothetical protein
VFAGTSDTAGLLAEVGHLKYEGTKKRARLGHTQAGWDGTRWEPSLTEHEVMLETQRQEERTPAVCSKEADGRQHYTFR